MKRFLAAVIALSLLLAGCAGTEQAQQRQYTATFLTLFDTVTTVIGRADSQESFEETAQAVHDKLLVYHQLFDIYNTYDGIHNLKTVNDNAGIAPVKVDEKIIRMLLDCKTYYIATGGRVNVAMGSVLQLWHEARSDGLDDPQHAYLPDANALAEAAKHTDPEDIMIDEAASTVFLSDPDMRLDVGAIAKGWAAEEVAKDSPSGLLISVGGNVCATGQAIDCPTLSEAKI